MKDLIEHEDYKDYGDEFGNLTEENNQKKIQNSEVNTTKYLIIISGLIITIIILLFSIIILVKEKPVSQSISPQEVKKVTSTLFQEKEEVKSKENSSNITVSKENKKDIAPTVPVQSPTENATIYVQDDKEISVTEPSTNEIETVPILHYQPPTEQQTSPVKILNVEDITLSIKENSIYIVTVKGNFDGYAEDELMAQTKIEINSGNISTYSPILSNDASTFNFNINLENCYGELHINIGNYDFYQTISNS